MGLGLYFVSCVYSSAEQFLIYSVHFISINTFQVKYLLICDESDFSFIPSIFLPYKPRKIYIFHLRTYFIHSSKNIPFYPSHRKQNISFPSCICSCLSPQIIFAKSAVQIYFSLFWSDRIPLTFLRYIFAELTLYKLYLFTYCLCVYTQSMCGCRRTFC